MLTKTKSRRSTKKPPYNVLKQNLQMAFSDNIKYTKEIARLNILINQLRFVGSQMSNIMWNYGQHYNEPDGSKYLAAGISHYDLKIFKDLAKQWDEIK